MSLDVHYFSFNVQRADKLWENFPDDLAQAQAGVRYDMYMDPLENLAYPEVTKNEDEVVSLLKFLDLNYGSVHGDPTNESGKLEWPILEALTRSTGLPFNKCEYTKTDWIQLYASIDNDFIDKTTHILAQDMGWNNEESREILLDFLRTVRPVVKDLKDNESSMFIYYADTSNEVYPESAEKTLMQRARDHLKKFYNANT